jgi:hypothetical protein
MNEHTTSAHHMTQNMLDLTAEAAQVNLVLPVWLSIELWQQLTGTRSVGPEDPRPYTLLAQLKNAIRENFDGHSYFGCLEIGIDFDVEIGPASATVLATMAYENGRAILRLRTPDECLEELCQTPALAAASITRNAK